MSIEQITNWQAHSSQSHPGDDVKFGRSQGNTAVADGHPLDSPALLDLHAQLMSWYTNERTRQSVNRYQMALDQDFYDGQQWNPDDIAELNERGQAPLVFNLIKPMCDWLIGTEKRTSFDSQVLPRHADGGEAAEVKTKAMKYFDDVNHAQFNFSRAFRDAVIVGLGWLECGIRGDTSDELIYDAYESWRNVLYDSSGKELDQNDWRYMFRWKWVDEDYALQLFPDRKDVIRSAVQRNSDLVPMGLDEAGEEFWYLGQALTSTDLYGMNFDRRTYVTDSAYVNTRRKRCRLIEAYWTEPVRSTVMRGMPEFHGQVFNAEDQAHRDAATRGAVSLFDGVRMEMHAAILTEKALLWAGKSPYRHNKFPLTPLWCYRRGRDNAPYGVVRGVRDAQEDYNKRASKALWLMSSVRTTVEQGAVEDLEVLREEVARPDCVVEVRKGFKLSIQDGAVLVEPQVMMMERDHAHIQATSGVTDELMGRRTNAVSGEAIKARQSQGSVVTAEVFDNARFSRQLHGQKRLSLMEQFVSEPRVIRLTGAKGKMDWVTLNEPVVNADGSVNFLNDITAEQADFVVSDADYQATYRQAMFQTMMEYLAKFPPEVGMKLLPHILEMSDIPDKEEFIEEIRQALRMPNPDAEVSPEQAEAMQAQQAQAQQMQALQLQLAEDEARAGIELKRAQAVKTLAEAEEKERESNQSLRQLSEEIAHLRMLLQAVQQPVGVQASGGLVNGEQEYAGQEQPVAG